jgi:hypothetical protein
MKKDTTKPVHMTMRLTSEADRLIRTLAAAKGISLAAVIELAVRDFAKREGIK